MLLTIKNLHAQINDKPILKGVDLTIQPGEIHAIMGPNGSGKSTLASILTGREMYQVTQGEVHFEGNDLLELAPEERARMGIFLSFQYPVEIPGVSMANFMRAAVNERRAYQGLEVLSAGDFLKMMREKMKFVEIDQKLINRAVNEGFSGGEKKKTKFFRWPCWNPGSPFSTKPTADSISMPSELLPEG